MNASQVFKPHRAAFDSVLSELAVRAGLAVGEWAVEKLRLAADELEKSLDKRAAELAAREG
jgi:hypothetical protein